MAAVSTRSNALLSRLKALFTLQGSELFPTQRFNHTLLEGRSQSHLYSSSSDSDSDIVFEPGQTKLSKWRAMDSRALGVTHRMISEPSYIVLKILRSEGFEAYLVGGCVRDLILNKIPKDFDVITTATLNQIKKQFHRAVVVGRRFPICRVHVKGSVIEVSSFETASKCAEMKEKFIVSHMPRNCDKLDLLRWRDCMHRDFTVNSMFFNPFMNKIYDYVGGMEDLQSLKLRTLVPAQLSFKEDSARIFRGLRIAARLGLSFTKETETAIRKLSSSTTGLPKDRVMMELNYMFSYGAANPSLSLLWKFNLLQFLLPCHAAYLAQKAQSSGQSSTMLMELFFNLDQLVSCDRPSDCCLWVGLLAFHLALVNSPQPSLIVLAFASILYHGRWKEGVAFARQHAEALCNFVPEISESSGLNSISDDELADKVTQLALLVQSSIGVLTETDSLLREMARFPDFPCSGLVFVSKKMGSHVAQIFRVLVEDIQSYKTKRASFEINYNFLGRGILPDIRFVLGKIVMDTMGCGFVDGDELSQGENRRGAVDVCKEIPYRPADLEKGHLVDESDKTHLIVSSANSEQKRENKRVGNVMYRGRAKKSSKVVAQVNCNTPQDEMMKKKTSVDKGHLSHEDSNMNTRCKLQPNEVVGEDCKHRQPVNTGKGSQLRLSSLFK